MSVFCTVDGRPALTPRPKQDSAVDDRSLQSGCHSRRDVAFRARPAATLHPAGHPAAAVRAARLRLRPGHPAPGVPLRARRPAGRVPCPGPAGADGLVEASRQNPTRRPGPAGVPHHRARRAGPAGVDGRHQGGARPSRPGPAPLPGDRYHRRRPGRGRGRLDRRPSALAGRPCRPRPTGGAG